MPINRDKPGQLGLGIIQTLILSEITTVCIRETKNRIKNEYKTMDERIGYLISLGDKEGISITGG